MNHNVYRALLVAASSASWACGQAPPGNVPQAGNAPSSPNLTLVTFTGDVNPASGRFQLVMDPQAAIGVITEDANGNPATATPGTAQVYGATVSFALIGGPGYPAGCTGAQAMYSDVQVLSGFTEQLRNVYARMTQVSSGQTFCNNATPGAIAPPLPNVGLYLYQPLNAGTAPSAISRSVQWAINLADNGAFWFKGDLWAEIIPDVPTITAPLEGASVILGGTTGTVNLKWNDDPRADGGGGDGYVVNRPGHVGVLLTILKCGPSSGSLDPSACAPFLSPPMIAHKSNNKGSYPATFDRGFWYQWRLQTVFRLPGASADSTGTLIPAHSFKTL